MKISDLTPDSRNANKGTAKGQKAIVNSIQRSGAGRSIVVDKNGRIIGGNKTTEAIAEVYGADAEVMVIETTGDKLLVHKRNDLDLDDPDPNNPARQLAYADNLTSWASFELDPAVVMADIEAGFNFEAVDISLPDLGELLDKSTREFLEPTDRANDPNEEWKGMPEFEQEDAFGAIATLKVHFETKNSIDEFSQLIGQNVTIDSKSIWYPKKQNLDLINYRAIGDEA